MKYDISKIEYLILKGQSFQAQEPSETDERLLR